MANLRLESVSKIYPSGALALYKAELNLDGGEFIAVVGGEKSGKSTLLRVIAGLENVTEGKIIIGDKDVTSLEPKERDVAVIFQGNTLYPSLSVADNLAYGLKVRRVSQAVIEQRVKAAAEILGLTDILARKPKMLTTEQKQLVAFGRAIVREPKLYLLDDPLSGIAPELKTKLRSVLINLQLRLKGTFVYATKNVNEALTMATKILVLRDGFIQQIDTPANLYDYPVNAYVAFMIGSPTVNFINGVAITCGEGGVFAEIGDVKIPVPENILNRFTALDEYKNTEKRVIVGIRPEDMGVGGEGFIKAKVSSSREICGFNYADCDGDKLSFVIKTNNLKKDDVVNLTADWSHMMLFDAETRLTLLARDEKYVKTDYADADRIPLTYGEEEEIKNKLKLKPAPKKKK